MTARAPFPTTTLLLVVLAGATTGLWGTSAPAEQAPSTAGASIQVLAVPAPHAVRTAQR